MFFINKKQALNIVKKNGLNLAKIPHKFKKDREIVLAAVRNDGFAFVDADKKFLNDKEIAIEAVKNNHLAYLVLINSNLMEDSDILKIVGLKS